MQTDKNISYSLTIDEIRGFLPHRYPMLLVDRVLSIEPKGDLTSIESTEDKVGSKVTALKNITFNEPIFTGHFPERSIFPGVMTLEAMAQAASLVLYPYFKSQQEPHDFSVILVGLNDVRFRRPITPGDTIHFEITLTKCRSILWQFEGKATVDGKLVAEATILANLNVTKRKT